MLIEENNSSKNSWKCCVWLKSAYIIYEWSLSKQLKKKIKQPQPTRKGKYLTAREKKDLGLSKLDKDGLRFETFKKLHYLWLDYMREIIDFGKIETSETAIDTGWVVNLVFTS